jgi:hypothetical protein
MMIAYVTTFLAAVFLILSVSVFPAIAEYLDKQTVKREIRSVKPSVPQSHSHRRTN